MGLTVLVIAIVAVVIGISAMISGSRTRRREFEDRAQRESSGQFYRRTGNTVTVSVGRGMQLIGGVFLVVGLLMGFMDSFTVVGSREVAMQVAFGKVQGNPLGAGWHWVSPVNNIEKFDASVQTLKFYQGEKEDDGDCITVRLANSTNACVDVTAQWNINYKGDVKSLYLSYKTFDNIHDNLVKRQLQSALNEVFGLYDPLASIGTDVDKIQTNTKKLQDDVREALRRDLGTAIEVPSVTIPLVHFDPDTENRLKGFQAAKADTQIATQQKLTAIEQAAANKLLAADSSIKDPGVQYQNCLNLIRELGKNGQLGNLPLTFNCDQGATSTPVIVQPK